MVTEDCGRKISHTSKEIISKLSSKTLFGSSKTGTVPFAEICNISSGLFFRETSLSSQSFEAKINIKNHKISSDIDVLFIRAPKVDKVNNGVEVLATFQEQVVAVRQGKHLSLIHI